MKTTNSPFCPVAAGPSRSIEMLVVMAVIAMLAAMIFPAFGAIKRKAAIQKAQTELKLVASAIEGYKEQ